MSADIKALSDDMYFGDKHDSKPKKHKDVITGYYIDIPEGGQMISVNGAEEVAVDSVPNAAYTAETETHYGLIEWGADVEIEEVEVDGNPVEVQTLIGGTHPVAKPK